MDPEAIAPMVIVVVGILTTGGVLVLRPIAKRLAEVLELYARDRTSGLERETTRMRELLETMHQRLELLEDRQDFTERLLSSGRPGEARGSDPEDGSTPP